MLVRNGVRLIALQGKEESVTLDKKNIAFTSAALILILFASTLIDKVLYIVDTTRYPVGGVQPAINVDRGMQELVGITNVIVTFVAPLAVIVLIAGAVFLAILPSLASAEPPPSGQGALRQMNDSFAGVFEKVSPAVVVIESKSPAPAAIPGLPQGLEFFLQNPDGSPAREHPNVGTGFLFRPDGHILTNFHVVENGGAISVKLHDGRKFPATLVGGDARSDVAVLKIEGDHFPVAALGDSDAVRIGEFAFAIGTPMELPYSFTVGVVSAKGRSLQIGGGYEFIQTDASINPGNSGGPLCDIEGRVVGINALISGTNRGLGFSLPINTAKDIAEQLMAKGRVVRPWLGIGISGIAYFCLNQGYQDPAMTPEHMSLFSTLIPVFGLFLSIMAGFDKGWVNYIGAGLIILSILFSNISKAPKKDVSLIFEGEERGGKKGRTY